LIIHFQGGWSNCFLSNYSFLLRRMTRAQVPFSDFVSPAKEVNLMATNIQNCPLCGRHLHILESQIGKRVVCPKCGGRFVGTGPSWLETPATSVGSGNASHRTFGKPVWAGATALLLAGILGGVLLLGRSASATSAPPAQPTAAAVKEQTDRQNARDEFHRLMVEGNAALTNLQFSDAIQSYRDARKLFPEDVDAAKGLAAARAGLADAQSAQSAPPVNPYLDALNRNVQVTQKAIGDQQTHRSNYMSLMNQASVASLDGRFDDAKDSYIQALHIATDPAGNPVLTLSSGDPYAPPLIQTTPSDAARDSRAALDGLREVNYQMAMSDGDLAMRAQRYHDAVFAFQTALRQRPNDPAACSGLAQARAYCG
jgi:tetratricopeptide (TPR) repeat protein